MLRDTHIEIALSESGQLQCLLCSAVVAQEKLGMLLLHPVNDMMEPVCRPCAYWLLMAATTALGVSLLQR
jgi:hypothetical protein